MVYDLIVVGGGPGGYVAAVKAAQLGLATALVEAKEFGGTCLNRGCIPTKALLHTANLYRENRQTPGLGLAEAAGPDMQQVYAHKDEIVTKQRDGITALLKANGITVYNGYAQVLGEGRLAVETDEALGVQLQAKNILLATGSAPVRLPVPGMDLPGVLTSDDLLAKAHDIKSIVIVGGGVIGVEFAGMLAAFGCEVTLLEAADRLLPNMDGRISQTLGMVFRKQGIKAVTGAALASIEETVGGLVCNYTRKGEEKQAAAQYVLVAVGRKAHMEGLFAEGITPKTGKNGIVVDESFATSLPGIYAIGDMVDGSIQLAHAASAEGVNAVCGIAGKPPEFTLGAIPSCVYTTPEIACVGVTQAEAQEKDLTVKTGLFNTGGLGKAAIESAQQGFIKLVFDENEVLVGAQLMCPRATDIIGELATAVCNRLTLAQLSKVVRPHPTFCEGVSEAAADVLSAAIHKVYR